jgi:error-prone DNA polymerase
VQGRIQREGDVVHFVANQLTDLWADLAGIGDRDNSFPLPRGRGDELHHGSPGVDPREALQFETQQRDLTPVLPRPVEPAPDKQTFSVFIGMSQKCQ